MEFRMYSSADIPTLTRIWNEIIEDGLEFARDKRFTESEFADFLSRQTAVNCMICDGHIAGFYILHPNDEGRRSHVANASFAMDKAFRGKRLGRPLVTHCIDAARDKGFRAMQFNAVVADNAPALHIYESLGFSRIGTAPDGFLLKNGEYRDLIMMYLPLR